MDLLQFDEKTFSQYGLESFLEDLTSYLAQRNLCLNEIEGYTDNFQQKLQQHFITADNEHYTSSTKSDNCLIILRQIEATIGCLMVPIFARQIPLNAFNIDFQELSNKIREIYVNVAKQQICVAQVNLSNNRHCTSNLKTIWHCIIYANLSWEEIETSEEELRNLVEKNKKFIAGI